jgi:PHD/YefM family antitoxin component YafN of YafNO toxin-antitoxin module
MKFISTRDLRNEPAKFRESLRDDEVVLTANGKPFALVMEIDESELEETIGALRQARMQRAVSRLRKQAEVAGTNTMSADEIEAEINAARKDRRRA